MPRSFEIALPNKEQREKILRLHLRNEALEEHFDFEQLGVVTADYSGSDLKELCRAALMLPLREHLDSIRDSNEDGDGDVQPADMRPLGMLDFQEALQMVQPTASSVQAVDRVVRRAICISNPTSSLRSWPRGCSK